MAGDLFARIFSSFYHWDEAKKEEINQLEDADEAKA